MRDVRVYHGIATDDQGRSIGMVDGYRDGHPVVLVFTHRIEGRSHAYVLQELYRLLNVGDDPEFGTPDPAAVEYRQRGNRSLSMGDVIEIDDTFYAVRDTAWEQLAERPFVVATSRPGSRPVPAADVPAVPVPRGTLRLGWVWGVGDGPDWLTVPGSAYTQPTLHPDPKTAGPKRLDWVNTLALVAEVPHDGVTGPRGVAYRILGRRICPTTYAFLFSEDGGKTWRQVTTGLSLIDTQAQIRDTLRDNPTCDLQQVDGVTDVDVNNADGHRVWRWQPEK